MPVIALASELASDGKLIAKQVAARLGLSFLDHSNVLDRLEQHGFSMPDLADPQRRKDLGQQKNWQLRKIGKIISSEILFLAQKNSMMLHSPYAPYLLAGVSHIPRIRVRTPTTQRAKNFAGAHACDEIQAFHRVRANDEREAFVLEACFGVQSPGRIEHFDLVADTGWLNTRDWTEQILDLVQDADFAPTTSSRAKLRALAAAAATAHSSGPAGADSCCSAACC
jgi:Cytidylate kinase-like family